jgi:hypothetical protein
MAGLNVRPMMTATLAKRTASSNCCGARLMMRPTGERAPGARFACRRCGQPCQRVLSEPEVTTAHG